MHEIIPGFVPLQQFSQPSESLGSVFEIAGIAHNGPAADGRVELE
jgi:hypothetical protein